jgi:hypothetical protein
MTEAPLSVWKTGDVCQLPPRASDAPAAWRVKEWEREEAKLSPSWALKYERDTETAEVRTEGAQPAICDMPPELAAEYAELAQAYNEARERDFSEIDAHAEVEAQLSAQREFDSAESIFEIRESTYIRHVRNRAGKVVSQEAADKARESRAQLDEDTIDMAMKLETVGRAAFGSGPQAWLVAPISGQVKPLVNVRKRAIFPAAAAQKRAPMVNALELLLRRPEHKFDQFCTFTGGQRRPLKVSTEGAEVREGLEAMHRKISKLNAQPFMKKYGARIIFRASELGGLVDDKGTLKKDAEGNWTLHLHAHCLINFKRFLSRPEMSEWTKAVWEFWEDRWSIDGAIEKVRESCKYCVKPADQKLLSPLELKALDTALFKLHRVQPLGQLREHIRYRKENCLTVKREERTVKRGGESFVQSIPVVLPDWNARKKNRLTTAEQRERAERNKKRREAEKERLAKGQGGSYEEPFGPVNAHQSEMMRWDSETAIESVLTAPEPLRKRLAPPQRTALNRPRAVFKNRIAARLSPAPYFGRVAEPGLLVWSDERPDVELIRRERFVADIVAVAGPLVAAAHAALARDPAYTRRVSVHTSPVTVPVDPPGKPRTPVLPALMRPQTWQKTALADA